MVTPVNNRCYNPVTKKWFPCTEQQALQNNSRRPPGFGASPPKICCIPDLQNCCFDCDRILDFASCLSFTLTSLNSVIEKGVGYTTFDLPTLILAVNSLFPCPSGWSIVDLGGGVYTLRDTVGILDCISNITLSNEGINFDSPGATIAQCLQLETDPECGSNLGICWHTVISDIGLPNDWYNTFGPVRFCSNADTLTNLLSCNQCF